MSAKGISPDPKKTEAIRKMIQQTNISELRNFLGMVNQLGKFIPQLAEKDKSLLDRSKKYCWVWGDEEVKAFQTLKAALSPPPLLVRYDPKRVYKADASPYGLGTVLLQRWREDWKPVAYVLQLLTFQ